jgi:hypothetical protein
MKKSKKIRVRSHRRKKRSGGSSIVKTHLRSSKTKKLNSSSREEEIKKKALSLKELYGELAREDQLIVDSMIYHTEQLLTQEDKDYGCIPLYEFSEKEWDCLKESNDIISGKRRIEVSRSKAETDGTIIMWFNSARRWGIGNYQQPVKKGDKVELMPNYILLPYPIEVVRKVICYLKEFPLYFGSFEAKARGEVSPKESFEIWSEGASSIIYKLLQKKYKKDD